jgi:hypothetical protein
VGRWQRRRPLATFARRKAWSRYWEIVRPYRWRVLLFTVSYYVGLTALHRLYPDLVGDVFFGAMLMAPPFVLSVVLAGDPSAAAWARGADSEGWTSVELRKAFGREYRVVDDVQLGDRGNADHVVVGPTGVWVVEVKWSSAPWASATGWERIRSACRQAKANARAVSRLLSDRELDIVAGSVVVLWGGEIRSWTDGTRLRYVDNTPVVVGTNLRAWSHTLDGLQLDDHDRDAVIVALQS